MKFAPERSAFSPPNSKSCEVTWQQRVCLTHAFSFNHPPGKERSVERFRQLLAFGSSLLEPDQETVRGHRSFTATMEHT